MKTYRIILLTIPFLFIYVTSVFSQNLQKKYSELIIGTWKIDSLDINSYKLSPEYETLVRQKMPEFIEHIEIQFLKNNIYHKKGNEGEKKGTWSISEDGKYVLVKIDGETKVSKTAIVKLTEDKLIIAPENPNSINSHAYLYKTAK